MFLSVVIPTYNRLPILRQCLQALERQSQEPPIEGYEVVVVDDGSTDATVAWLEGAIAAGELPHLRLIRQEHGGPAQGRNRAYARKFKKRKLRNDGRGEGAGNGVTGTANNGGAAD